MGNEKLLQQLNDVTRRVLEQSAFIFADEIENLDEMAVHSMEMVQVTLDYSGKESGEVSLILPRDLCTEVCNNMLGAGAEDCMAGEYALDSAKELANIVVGQFLTEVYGSNQTFNQSTPRIKTLTAEELSVLLNEEDCTFAVADSQPVIAMFSDRKQAYEHQSTGR